MKQVPDLKNKHPFKYEKKNKTRQNNDNIHEISI